MTLTPPSPPDLDALAKEYLSLKDAVLSAKLAYAEAQNQMELKAESLKDLVSKFGGAHAEKSKILHGTRYEMVCTFPQELKQDAAAIEVFRGALKAADQSRLLNKVFDKTIRWTLNPKASEIIRGTKLSSKLQALWATCIVVESGTPRLQVREKQTA